MLSDIPMPDSSQMTAFYTEELRTTKTRPYFIKILTHWKSGNTPSKLIQHKQLQRHLDHVQQTKRNPNIQLLSPWSNTETRSTSKYLGINISSDLSWSTHVEDLAARENRTVGFLRRNFRECTLSQRSTPHWSTPQLIRTSKGKPNSLKSPTPSSQVREQQLH